MAKVLITGASGFIGGFLVEKGLQNGDTVYAAIRKTSNTKYLTDKRINIIYLNLSDKDELVKTLKEFRETTGKFDYIIHNAGATKVLDKADFEKVNYRYSVNFVEALIEADMVPGKFIYMSSLAAYGPGNEDTFAPIKPTDTPSPITSYGKSKLKTEQFLFKLKNFPFIIFRPTGVYGPRDTGYLKYFKTIKNHFDIYIGDTGQLLSFIYIDDLVSLIFKSLKTGISNKGYFVTDGRNYSSKKFADISKKVLNKRTIRVVIPYMIVKTVFVFSERFAKVRKKATLLGTDKYKEITRKNWACDASDTIKDFNFKPAYDLEKGVEATIKWYKENNWL